MHVSKVVRARRLRLSYLTTLSVVALLAAQVWGGGIAWAVTPVTAGCTGTKGDMAGLAAAVAAVTTGQTAEIDLVAGCTYTFDSTTPGPLTLAQGITLTIKGNGATITGAASGAIISVAAAPSTLTVDNVTFSGNSASSGGAIYDNTYGGTLHVTNSRFSNNSAVGIGGGAIYVNGGTITIDNSTFASNHADGSEQGGAISNSGTITITNSTFSGNTANGSSQYSFGGAIQNTGQLNVTNSTFSGNSATRWGGAIDSYGGSHFIKNTTFSGNTAGEAGAAIYNEYTRLTLSGNLFNANTVTVGGVVAVQSCSNFSTTPTDQGYNVADDATCFTVGTTGDVTTTAALIGLGSLASNGGPTQTMAITSSSSAYHAVAAAMCPATDQRGHPRLAVSTTLCDAGAFEVDGATTPITVTVNGSQTYGSSSPTLTDTASGGSVTGTVSCTGLTVTGNGITTPTAVSSTLAAATGYALAVTGCSGLSTDASHTISYVGGTFSVTPAIISVTVTGSQTYGGSPTFSYPPTTGVTGTATCTTVNGGTSITPTLAAGGSYTIDGTSCSGLSTDISHSISYVGGTFTVLAPTLQSIAVTPTNPSVAKGLTQQFTATGTYSDSSTADLTSTVTWSSGTTANVTISASGLATALNTGTSLIGATLGAINGSTTMTVTAPVLQSIAVTPANPSVAKGLTEQFSATGTYSDSSTADLTSTVTWSSGTTANVTISTSGLATAVNTGTSLIRATLGAVSGSTTMTVTSAVLQSIAVTPVNPSVAKGLTQQFTATGTYSDSSTADLTSTVTWSSGTTANVTISTSGLATAVNTGTSLIRATLGAINGSTTMTVTAAVLQSIAVTPVNPSVAKGLTQQFTATGTYSDSSTADLTSTVTWSSGTTANVTISTAGLATAVNIGTSLIGATLGAVSGSTTMTVTAAVLQSIAVTPANPSVAKGLTQQFTATGTYSDSSTADLTSTVTWSSGTTANVTISTSGLATAVNTGTSLIRATLGAVSGSTTMTVTAAALQSIAVTPANPSVAKGLTEQFTATGTYSDSSTADLTSTVTWSSGTTSDVTISTSGLATAVNTGTSLIRATLGAVSGSTTMTVTSAVLQSIAVTPINPSVAKGLTQQFTATGTYSDSSTADLTSTVTWSSGTTANVTISTAGLATAVNIGTSLIGATLGAINGSTTMTVTAAALQSIAITPTNPSVAKGLTQQFTAAGTYSDNSTADLTSTVTWSSGTTSDVTISTSGLATAVNTGTSLIRATLGAVSGSTTMTVTAAALQSIAVTPTNPSVAKGLTQQFTATGTYSDSSTADLTSTVTWSSGTTSDVTISTSGLATAVNTGTSLIRATLGAVSGSTTMTVTAAVLQSIAVTPTNPSVAKGLTQQFTATGTYSDSSTANITSSVTWSSGTTANVTISTAGLATALNTGTSLIGATLSAVNGSTTMTVTSSTLQSIAVTPANPSVAKGLTEQFTATGTYSDNSTSDLTPTVTWSSATTANVTISSSGLATAVNTGTSLIGATLGAVSGSTTMTVTSPVLQSIAVTPTNPSLAKGLTQQFTATGTYSDSSTANITSTVTWSSGTTSNVTISTAGLATALNTGTSLIGATLSAVNGSTTMTVTSPTLQSIAVTPANPSVAKGLTQQFTATGTYSDSSTANITSTVTWSSGTTANVTISTSGLATALNTGTSLIGATLGAINGSTTMTVTAAALRSIAVTPANPSVAKGLTQQFTATGTYSDSSTADLTSTVTWSSGTTSDVTISTSGLATAVNTGTSLIGATLGAINGSTTMTVTSAVLESIAVTPANPSVAKGLTQQFTATGTYSDSSTADLTSTVTWSSGTTSKVTISTSGLATALNTGTSLIGATLGAINGSTTMTVTSAVLQSIAVTPANPSVAKGLTQQFTATGTYSDSSTADLTSTVTWSSGTTANVTISASGLATAVNTGTSLIRATLGAVSGSTTMTVTSPVLQSIAVTPTNPSVPKGFTQQFTATGTYSDSTTQDITSQVTWSSATTSNATISTSGLATAVNTGTSIIGATLSAVTGSTTMTVASPVLVSIAVAPANPSVAKGLTQQFTATGTYSDSSTANITSTVTWSSGTTANVTISTAGLATAVNTGTSLIDATLGAINGSTTMTVTSAVLESIAVAPVNPSVAKGLTQQFTATGTYSDSSTADLTSTVTWSSGTTSNVTISIAGLATAVNAGTSLIGATLSAVNGSTTMTVTVPVLESIAVTPVNPSVAKGLTQQFTATGTYSDSSTADITSTVTWSSGTTTKVTISTAGLATAVNTGTSLIGATSGAINGSTTMTVTQAAQTITFTSTPPTNPVVTGSYNVSASASSGLAVAFSIDANSAAGACTISGSVVSFTGAGNCIVDANQPGDANYAPAPQAQQTIAIGKKTTTVSLVVAPDHIALGQSVTMTATVAGDPPTGTVSFTDNGNTLSCSPVTLVPGVNSSTAVCTAALAASGSHSIVATYSGDGNFVGSTSSATVVTVSVSAAATPAPALDRWATAMLAGLLGLGAFLRIRRARQSVC